MHEMLSFLANKLLLYPPALISTRELNAHGRGSESAKRRWWKCGGTGR
jgi:hypothetical protein